MRDYEKPLVEVLNEQAEGVYAASGGNGTPGCDSQYMGGVYQHYEGGWNKNAKQFYGCIGCPAYRETGCGLQVDQAYLDGATSYNTDNGNRMPEWERKGASPNRMIDDTNGLVY